MRMQGKGQRERKRENPQADSLLSMEPDMGLDIPGPREHDLSQS